VTASDLIVTTGSQQALDLLGKTLISPGDKVIVEGPTFLATIQCFRLYGAQLITAPVDGPRRGCTDAAGTAHRRAQAQVRLPHPHLRQPQRRHAQLERRQKVLELAVKHNTLVVEDDPYGDLYFGEAPPPSSLAHPERHRARQP
jgi:2-aminoadipate transaminase